MDPNELKGLLMNCKKTRLFSMKNKSKKISLIPENSFIPQNIIQNFKNEPLKEIFLQKGDPKNNEKESKINQINPNMIKFYLDTLNSKPLKGPKYLINNGF